MGHHTSTTTTRTASTASGSLCFNLLVAVVASIVLFLGFIFVFTVSTVYVTQPAKTIAIADTTLASTTELLGDFAGYACSLHYNGKMEMRRMDFCQSVLFIFWKTFVAIGKYVEGDSRCFAVSNDGWYESAGKGWGRDDEPLAYLKSERSLFMWVPLGTCDRPVEIERNRNGPFVIQYHLARVGYYNPDCNTTDIIPGYYHPPSELCWFSTGPMEYFFSTTDCQLLCIRPEVTKIPQMWTIKHSHWRSLFGMDLSFEE